MALYRRTDFVLDQEGRGVSGALVTVIDPNTGAPAFIFSDDAGLVPLANPFLSDPVGKFSYVAQQGVYRETVSRPGYYDDTTEGVVVGVLAGPQGEAGPQGPQGERGPSGAPGADLSAANNWAATQNFQYGIMSPLVSDVSQLQGDSLDILGVNQISGNSNGVDRPPTFYFYPSNAVELDGSLDVIGVLSQNGVPILPAFAASSGSSLVGFIQSGTGAVARTVQDKARESVSVKDFGAVGDGVTDDTAAITAAILSVTPGGGVVNFGAGTYLHNGFALADGVSIQGVGAGKVINAAVYGGTVLKNMSATNSITIGDGSTDIRNCRVKNLRITSSGAGLIGIVANKWGNMDSLDGVMVDTHVNGGVSLLNCWNLTISDCWIGNITNGYGIKAGNSSNNCRIEKTMVFQCATDGLQAEGCFNLIVDKCDFESNYNNQIRIMTGSNRGIVINNCYFEGLQAQASGYYGIKFDAGVCDTATIVGNFCDLSNATAGVPITFLDVDAGNTRINFSEFSFANPSDPTKATFVAFRAGASNCTARVALTTNPCTNASVSCRIHYDPASEVGVIAGSNGSQSMTGGAQNAFSATSVSMDPKSEWNADTFRPKDFGLYEIEYSVALSTTSGDNITIRLYDTTGAYEYARTLWQSVPTGVQSLQGTFREILGPGAAVQIQINPSATRATNAGGTAYNWIRIRRVC